MYITKKIALRKTRIHSDDTSIEDLTGQLPWIDVKAYIEKGEEYYQICNGTIGRGRHCKNYSVKAMMELINSEATVWVMGYGSCNKDQLYNLNKLKKDNVIKIKKKKTKQILIKQTEQTNLDFSIDDIPF